MSLLAIAAKKIKGKKALGILAGVMALTLTLTGQVALAQELTMATDGNVRKEASTSSEKVAGASKGSTYTIEEETTGSDGNTWYKITIDGKSGYVRADLVKVSSEDGEGEDNNSSSTVLSSSASVIATKTDTTNVRSGPSTGDSVVTQAPSGQKFDVVGETMDDSGNLWYQVDIDGKEGYLRSDTVEVVETADAAPEQPEEPVEDVPEEPEDTTTISSVVSSRVLPAGSNLENMSIDLETLQGWESGNYYVLYTKSTNDDSDPGEWYLYSIEDNQFQRIATLDAGEETEAPKKKLPSFKGDKKLIFIIAGVVLFIIILALILILIRRRDSGMYEEMDNYPDDDDEDDVPSYSIPSKRGARSNTRKDPAPRNFLSRRGDSDLYEDEEEDDDDEEYAPRKGRRIMAPGREEQRGGAPRRQSAPRNSARRYQDDDEDEEYMDDDDFEFEFLNDK